MIYDDKVFAGIDFTVSPPDGVEYNGCRFEGCNFSGLSLRGIELIDCVLVDCNLTQVSLQGGTLSDLQFVRSKLLGVDFSVVNKFQFSVFFNDCNLDYCIFLNLKMKGFKFVASTLKSAIFEGCDLTGASFDKCLLSGTSFVGTNLAKADFRTSSEYEIDPNKCSVKGARFSYPGVLGLLRSFNVEVE